MITLKETTIKTRTKTTTLTVTKWLKTLRKGAIPQNILGYQAPGITPAHRQAMQILKLVLVKYKYEILKTSDGYKIITNGRGEFREIQTSGMLAKPKTIKARQIYATIEQLDREGKLDLSDLSLEYKS